MRLIFSAIFPSIFSVFLLATNASSQDYWAAKGRVKKVSISSGDYYQYIPNSANPDSKILVIVHGSLSKSEPAIALAEKFIRRWISISEQQKVILVSPAFTARDYQSYGGYRGLFGRNVGADIFVQQIVRRYSSSGALPKFYLYGHSAGGQFVIRYLVKHPENLIAAVASAPGRYAFPDTKAPWPYGMSRLKRNIVYENPNETQQVDIVPDPSGWLNASKVPLSIIVGAKDTQTQPSRPGHVGKTRIDLAKNWVESMRALATRKGITNRFNVKIIPGIGHSSAKLTPHCAKTLFAF